jgi:phi13 family phage major tail protein
MRVVAAVTEMEENMANQQGANAYSEGYFYGILDIYVALMTGADGPSTKPTYGSYQVMGKTIEAQITPNYKEGKVYASNTATRSEKRVDSYTVSLNLDKIPYAIREIILCRYKDKNGVQIVKGNQQAPFVAIAFALTLDDGSLELWTLYKGKFSEPTQVGHTDADTITYQHPTIEATFIRREYDDALAAIAATADQNVMETVKAGWFTSVYEAKTT